MSKFLQKIQEVKNDERFGFFQNQYMFGTGLTLFDYMNGNMEAGQAGEEPRYNVGVDGGKIITIVGKPGSGKSTIAVQMAANIIKRYKNGAMFILDFEQSHTYNRVKTITGMTDEEVQAKVDIRQTGISTETVLELAIQLRDLKLANAKELTTHAENGQVHHVTGDPLDVLEPTVILIDSVAMMMPREARIKGEEKGDMGSNMDAAHAAKTNAQLMRRLAQILKEANIIVIFINHIQSKINTGPFQTKGDLQYLKQDETLPGGTAVQFMANTLIKLTYGTKLHEDKTYQIKGSEIILELIKSRTAPSGTSGIFIFNQQLGFDNNLTLLKMLTDEGYRKGSPVSYYLDGLEDYKFRLSNFNEVLEKNPEFYEKFIELSERVLKSKYKNVSYGTLPEQVPTDEEIVELDQEQLDATFEEE